jgi:hypothetical protein
LIGQTAREKLQNLWDSFPGGTVKALTSGVSNEGIKISKSI